MLATACGGAAPSSATTAAGHDSGATAQAARAARALRIPSGDWRTFDDNAARSGAAPRSGITAANVGRLRLRTVRIDGIADSSPIELHAVLVGRHRRDVAVVTTSYGRTIAFDPGTGARLWQFVPAGVNSTPGNYQVTNTSPVADPNRRFVYAAAPNGVIYKLSLASGRVVWARSITFDPRHEKMDSALNLTGPYVVAVTGGYYGDPEPYAGHVAMISRASGRLIQVWNSQCSDRHRLIHAGTCPSASERSAIWGRAGTVIESGSHRILTATGNGWFNGRTDWGDSALELTSTASQLLQNWTPPNQAQLSSNDRDVGSTIPALVPVYHGLQLVVQGGKDGLLRLLDLRRLSGTVGPPSPHVGGELSQVASPGGGEVFTMPIATRTGGRILVFVATDAGTAAYGLSGGAHPRLHTVWSSQTAGTSPVLSGGLLYIYDEQDGRMVIRIPATGRVVRSLAAGTGHWNSPIVVGGRIIEPTGNYHSSDRSSLIDIWHLPGR